MATLSPLFSGSRGNSTLIQTPKANILLDVGFGYKAIVNALKERNLAPQDISAIIITHEHSDHISALSTWAKYFTTPVYAPQGTGNYIIASTNCTTLNEVADSFQVVDAWVDIYRCSHDARACFGYKFSDGQNTVASVTDTGIANMKLVNFLADCHSIILESNHDVQMLQNGHYPEILKRRISSDLGHLSNDQSAKVLQKLLGSKVQNVVLGHLSMQNNTKQAALQTANAVYIQSGAVGQVNLFVADQFANGVKV